MSQVALSMGNVLGECHTPNMLKNSLVDFEKKSRHIIAATRDTIFLPYPTLYTVSVADHIFLPYPTLHTFSVADNICLPYPTLHTVSVADNIFLPYPTGH